MNIYDFFDNYGIEYFTSGKNVSKGWVNIQCPFCSDQSNHLGVRLTDKRVSCWNCGDHELYTLIKKITGESPTEIKNIKKQLATEYASVSPLIYANTKRTSQWVSLPQASPFFPKLHLDYLKKRGFRLPNKLIKKYNLQAVYTFGKYKYRIIIPIYLNKKIVSFTSRDVSDQQDPPYKNASPEEVTINVKRTIYNIDRVKEHGDIIITEGPIDVWKLGDGAICFFGVKFTVDQISLLIEKRIDTCFLLLDRDEPGINLQKLLIRILSPLCRSVEVVELTKKADPGELTLAESAIIRKELGFSGGVL